VGTCHPCRSKGSGRYGWADVPQGSKKENKEMGRHWIDTRLDDGGSREDGQDQVACNRRERKSQDEGSEHCQNEKDSGAPSRDLNEDV